MSGDSFLKVISRCASGGRGVVPGIVPGIGTVEGRDLVLRTQIGVEVA